MASGRSKRARTGNWGATMGPKRVSVIVGTVVAVFGAATVVGFTFDRPYWLSEATAVHEAFAGEINENTVYRHEQRAFYIEERIWRLELRLKELKGAAPVVDRHRLRRLKKQLATAENRLQKVRGY
jgi:hypothetical protein